MTNKAFIKCWASFNETKQVHTITMLFHHKLKIILIFIRFKQLQTKNNDDVDDNYNCNTASTEAIIYITQTYTP